MSAEEKNNTSIIYNSQSYYKTPQTIRQNSNYFLLAPGLSGKNLTNIATDHTDSDEFKKEYRKYFKDGDLMLIDTVTSKFYRNLGLE